MFDNLRQDASSSPLFQEDEVNQVEPRRSGRGGMFLGMSAAQRFVIALLLFMLVCVLGTFCLLATEKIWLPF